MVQRISLLFRPQLLAQSDLGDGRIDNFLIDSSVHLFTGMVVLISLLVAVGLVGLDAFHNRPLGRLTKIALPTAQVVLAVQLLLGIKLLDQGQGISQLYIHYVGGMIPLGAFLVGGWFARGDTGRSSRVLAVLLTIGLVSALMAFFIGRAYVESL